MSYPDYMQKHIFDPAGMADSGFPLRDGSRPELAIGYTPGAVGGSDLQPNIGMLPIRGCPAGSSSHTAADLLRFNRAVRSGKLLGPGWTGWLFTGTVPSAEARKRPFTYAEEGLGIAGGGPGVNAMLESGGHDAMIVLANLDPPIAGQVVGRLREAFQLALD
jgi:CubicO group peptidase (beta-lactamase class C family)